MVFRFISEMLIFFEGLSSNDISVVADGYMPCRTFKKVLFPAPDSPIRATFSPRENSREMFFMWCVPSMSSSYLKDRFWTAIFCQGFTGFFSALRSFVIASSMGRAFTTRVLLRIICE